MSLITDSEAALKAAATASGDSLTAARRHFQRQLKNASAALSEVSQPVFEGTRKGAAEADVLARRHPWTVAGVAIASGVALGIVIGFLATRRLED
jgi:ElaB/YqjD/DUF883 family membrane-anchored ribosome-binding protein